MQVLANLSYVIHNATMVVLSYLYLFSVLKNYLPCTLTQLDLKSSNSAFVKP
jgi:hypothetical protein